MPIFGTSSQISSLATLGSLDSSARLSVKKQDGKNILVATKGTLSDGLYSLWARFCPNQAHQAYLDTLNTLKKMIQSELNGEKANITFLSQNNASDAPSLKGAYLNIQSQTVDPCANFSSIERILYKNQFQIKTDQTDYREKQDIVNKIHPLFKKNFIISSETQKKIPEILLTELFSAASGAQYKTPTNEEQDHFTKLKEAVNISLQTQKTRKNSYFLKNFETALIKFLDENPQVSLSSLNSYLDNYDVTVSTSQSSETNQVLSNVEFKQQQLDQQNTISSYPQLSEQIAEIKSTNNYSQFFELLKTLSNSTSIFHNAKLKKETSLDKNEREIFISQLLGAFTIKKNENKSLHEFFSTLGSLLQSKNIIDQEISDLKNNALKILEENYTSEQKAKKVSEIIKKRVNTHQNLEQKWKEDIKTNPDAVRPKMKHIPNNRSAVSTPHLSGLAKSLLAFTILSLTQEKERVNMKEDLTQKFGITFIAH